MYNDLNDLTDRELLLVTAHEVQDLNRAVQGNGQPGLIRDVASLQSRTDSLRTKATTASGPVALIALVIQQIAYMM